MFARSLVHFSHLFLKCWYTLQIDMADPPWKVRRVPLRPLSPTTPGSLPPPSAAALRPPFPRHVIRPPPSPLAQPMAPNLLAAHTLGGVAGPSRQLSVRSSRPAGLDRLLSGVRPGTPPPQQSSASPQESSAFLQQASATPQRLPSKATPSGEAARYISAKVKRVLKAVE